MLGNFRKAMRDKGISAAAIAALIGTTEKTVNNKINGETDFTLPEALAIRENLFPEYDLCYLYRPCEEVA